MYYVYKITSANFLEIDMSFSFFSRDVKPNQQKMCEIYKWTSTYMQSVPKFKS
jgi:hypothetical protein